MMCQKLMIGTCIRPTKVYPDTCGQTEGLPHTSKEVAFPTEIQGSHDATQDFFQHANL